MKRASCLIAVVGCLIAGGSRAAAQEFTLDWFSVSQVGIPSTGGDFALTGSIDQAAAEVLDGGDFSVSNGLWTLLAGVPTPGAPSLRIAQNADQATISWEQSTAAWVLESTAALLPPPQITSWVVVPPASYQTNALRVSVGVTTKPGATFYRLRQP